MMGRFSGLMNDIEGALIREDDMLADFQASIDEIESYEAVDIEQIAGFYGEDSEMFEDRYWEETYKGNSSIPVLEDKTAAVGFIIGENTDVESLMDGFYSAAYRPGKIEVYNEELWRNTEFQRALNDWQEWRTEQFIGPKRVKKLEIEKLF